MGDGGDFDARLSPEPSAVDVAVAVEVVEVVVGRDAAATRRWNCRRRSMRSFFLPCVGWCLSFRSAFSASTLTPGSLRAAAVSLPAAPRYPSHRVPSAHHMHR